MKKVFLDAVLQVVSSFEGYPTTNEVAGELNISWITANKYLFELERKGNLKKIVSKSSGKTTWKKEGETKNGSWRWKR